MKMLPAMIDTILPGDASLGMPPASEAGVATYFAQHGLATLVADFTQLLEGVALANVRLFSAFLTQVLRAYYTAPEVLRLIGTGSVPPFPSGNELAQDDWSMLEVVFERGQVYREVL